GTHDQQGRVGLRGHFGSHPPGDHRSARPRAGARHRRGRAVRDVAQRRLQARQGARARRPGAPRPPGARARAVARRRAAARGGAAQLELRRLLERAPRPPGSILRPTQEGGAAMKTIDVTVSRTIAAPAERVYEVWLDKSSPGGPWFGCKRAIVDPRVDGL